MAPRIRPVAILPTLCTLGNTFCGFLAISKIADALLHQNAEAFRQNIVFAAWMIVLAMVFDALDGKIARLTNQTTDFGAQLDSLTDLITFGVAPAFLVKVVADYTFTTQGVVYQDKLPLLLTSVYAICAALRLARFTLETEPDPKAHETFEFSSILRKEIGQRNLAKTATLDYWESGMDLGLSRDIFDSFLKYQALMAQQFKRLQRTYDFDIVDGHRSALTLHARDELRILAFAVAGRRRGSGR